jgi:hypothetical protein
LIEWGYEKYPARIITIQVGFTDEFVKSQPDTLGSVLQVFAWSNLARWNFIYAMCLSRQGT